MFFFATIKRAIYYCYNGMAFNYFRVEYFAPIHESCIFRLFGVVSSRIGRFCIYATVSSNMHVCEITANGEKKEFFFFLVSLLFAVAICVFIFNKIDK